MSQGKLEIAHSIVSWASLTGLSDHIFCNQRTARPAIRGRLETQPNLTLFQQPVDDLTLDGDRVTGVVTQVGITFEGDAVVLTTGTFLSGLIHVGLQNYEAGRAGEPPAKRLGARLRELDLPAGRLKTGTPPRLDGRTIDFSALAVQPGDDPVPVFSFLGTRDMHPRQLPCWITHTNARTHDVIRGGLDRSPLYTGVIKGVGPRYCPSIEDKVVRFAEKERHHVFVEPEGLQHPWLYLNGVSTSLPPDVQDALVRSLPGFENAVIARYGYAVEYDFVNPEQLEPTLQVRGVDGLFLAGQINGTSGYEEAAAQGLLAGINALQQIRGAEPVVLRRDQAYAGVMIDDLVTLGTEEPYRMFTSRAEHRLLLGCDSVYERLSPVAARLGILDDERKRRIESRIERMNRAKETGSVSLTPNRETQEWLPIQSQTTVAKLMQRADFDLERFLAGAAEALPELTAAFAELNEEEAEGVVNQLRYAGYIERQQREASKTSADEELRIPAQMSYALPGLSREMVEKLSFVRPASLGQASRIPGVTPAAISILRMQIRRGRVAQG